MRAKRLVGVPSLARQVLDRTPAAVRDLPIFDTRHEQFVFLEVILDKLGQGGMGVVLKAMHRRMDRIVAIKLMSAAGMKSPDAVQRFHREVKAAAKLTLQISSRRMMPMK